MMKPLKKVLGTAIALVLAMGMMLPALAEKEVSIFVGTDRHAQYETETLVPVETEGNDGTQNNKLIFPVFDEDGNFILHNNLTGILRLVKADDMITQPSVVLLGGDNVGEGGSGSTDTTGYPMGTP